LARRIVWLALFAVLGCAGASRTIASDATEPPLWPSRSVAAPAPLTASRLPKASDLDLDPALLHVLCNTGLRLLISAKAWGAMRVLVDSCESGPHLIASAMLLDGLTFGRGSDRAAAASLLHLLIGRLLRERFAGHELAMQCVMRLTGLALGEANPVVRRYVELLLLNLSSTADVAAHVIGMLDAALVHSDPETPRRAVSLLTRMAIAMDSQAAIWVLSHQALQCKSPVVRAHAASSLARVVVSLSGDAGRDIGDGVKTLCRAALLDSDGLVRCQASYALKRVAVEARDPVVSQAGVGGIVEMAVLSLEPLDRQIGVWRLLELAVAMRHRHAGLVTSRFLETMSRLAREDVSELVRRSAHDALEMQAENLRTFGGVDRGGRRPC